MAFIDSTKLEVFRSSLADRLIIIRAGNNLVNIFPDHFTYFRLHSVFSFYTLFNLIKYEEAQVW